MNPVELIDPPASMLLMRVTSPGFAATPPDIVHPERVPAAIWEACAAHRQAWFEPRPVSVWLLRDVYVACEGLVFDSAGRLYRASVTQHGSADIEWAASQIAESASNATIPIHDGPLVLCKKRGAMNYGHWLMEMLPMLYLVLSRLIDPKIGVLLHDVTDRQLGEVMQTCLVQLGIASERVRISDFYPVRVRSLILVEGLTTHGTYMSPLVRECHERLAYGIAGIGRPRVFIARGHGRSRDFADPVRAEALAEEQGYFVLRPERCSFMQQVAAMRDAEIVAGAMGAAMTSLAYVRDGARILSFAGAAMPDTFFWFVATLFGHRYREIRCKQSDGAPGGSGYDHPLLIDDAEFRACLAAS